jgi:hypothetical protein
MAAPEAGPTGFAKAKVALRNVARGLALRVSVGDHLGNAIGVFALAMPGRHALIRFAGQG